MHVRVISELDEPWHAGDSSKDLPMWHAYDHDREAMLGPQIHFLTSPTLSAIVAHLMLLPKVTRITIDKKNSVCKS